MGNEREAAEGERLTDDRQRLTAALWDLRDDAYDCPDRWSAATAETVFQVLASTMEGLAESDELLEPVEFGRLVRAEVDRLQRTD